MNKKLALLRFMAMNPAWQSPAQAYLTDLKEAGLIEHRVTPDGDGRNIGHSFGFRSRPNTRESDALSQYRFVRATTTLPAKNG